MPSKRLLHANSQLHCMKKACGCFDEQALQVLQMTFIRPSGKRHNILRDALKTVRCLPSPVARASNSFGDGIHFRAHLSRAESKA